MENIALVSEENFVAYYDLTSSSSDKSIVECTDYSSKSTISGDASTTMEALALESEYNVIADSESALSDKSISTTSTLFSTSPSDSSKTMASTIL